MASRAAVARGVRANRLRELTLDEAEAGFSVEWDGGGGGVKVSSWFIASRFKAEVLLRTCLK